MLIAITVFAMLKRIHTHAKFSLHCIPPPAPTYAHLMFLYYTYIVCKRVSYVCTFVVRDNRMNARKNLKTRHVYCIPTIYLLPIVSNTPFFILLINTIVAFWKRKFSSLTLFSIINVILTPSYRSIRAVSFARAIQRLLAMFAIEKELTMVQPPSKLGGKEIKYYFQFFKCRYEKSVRANYDW